MRREIKIERAQKLREEGWTLRQIAERFRVSQVTIWRWLNPEAAKEKAHRSNAKRTAQKREWARNHRGICPDCGGPMGAGSRGRTNGPKRCKECAPFVLAERVHQRALQIEEWWAAGLLLKEIAAKLGWSIGHLSVEMVRLRELGYDLPYRYRSGCKNATKFPEQVAA